MSHYLLLLLLLLLLFFHISFPINNFVTGSSLVMLYESGIYFCIYAKDKDGSSTETGEAVDDEGFGTDSPDHDKI
jgi:hypothetical protein